LGADGLDLLAGRRPGRGKPEVNHFGASLPVIGDSLTRRLLRETFRVISAVQATLEGEWVSRIK